MKTRSLTLSSVQPPSPPGVFALVAHGLYQMPCEELLHLPQGLVEGKLSQSQLVKKGQAFPNVMENPSESWDKVPSDARVLS